MSTEKLLRVRSCLSVCGVTVCLVAVAISSLAFLPRPSVAQPAQTRLMAATTTAKPRLIYARPRRQVATKVPTLAAAPQLLSPTAGYFHSGTTSPAFTWSSGYALTTNDYYQFAIEHRMGVDIRCTKATTLQARDYIPLLQFSNGLPFTWSITIVRAASPVADGEATLGGLDT